MSKITLNHVGSLIDATTAKTTINNNSDTIETAFDNTLSLDGTAPNQMGSELDMNSHQVLNLPTPATANSPLRLQDLSDFIGGGTVTNIPTGGTTGQVLAKNSSANFDAAWRNSVTSVGLALPTDFAISNSPVTTTGTLTGAWVTAPTGTGAVVRATSPTLVTPALGTPTSGVATNLTGTAAGLTAGHVTTNANLTGPIASVGNATSITSQTGTGTKFVVDTSPVLVTPNLGTPSAAVLTNATGTASGLTAGNVTTNANLTGPIASVGNATSITSQTGTGTKFVVDTSPVLVTPNLGTPSAAVLTNATGLPTAGIVDANVTYAKIQNVAGLSVFGRSAATSGVGAAVTGTDVNQILRVDTSGNTIGFGSVNLAASQAVGSSLLPLANGGLNAALTASNGGILYSTASAGAILAGTATARQMLQSGTSTTPAWSTTTWPATTTINRLLYSSAANVISDLATANSSLLVTDSGGIPSLSTTVPNGVVGTTQAVDDATTKLATDAFVLNQAAAATPAAVTNTAVVGTSTRFARADHAHPYESTAWTSYTPTVSAGSGTFTLATATARYKIIGKTIHLQADVTITTVGSAAGTLVITLPPAASPAAAFAYVGSIREHNLTGKSGAAVIPASGTTAFGSDATGTTLIAAGNVVAFGITYEIP